MIRKTQEHRWERILRLEPRLSSYEARSRIEAALAAFVQAKAFQKKRSLKRPWGFSYHDVAKMRKRVTELKKEIQPYLPQQRTNSELYVKVRQCATDFDIVAGYLRELECGQTELGSIRESFTGKALNEKRGRNREFIHTCLDGLGERENSITNALTYVVDHPEEFRRLAIPDGPDEQ